MLLGLNPYQKAPDGKLYFYHGNTRIKVTEHFPAEGKPMESLLEDVILYHAKHPDQEDEFLPAC